MSRRRIFYIYQRNPLDRFVQSGRPYALLQELKKSGCDIEVVDVGTRRYETITRCFAACYRLVGRSYVRDRYPPYLRALANRVEHALASATKHDFVFAPSSLPLYHARCGLPKVLCVDATFHAMVGYYPDLRRLPRRRMKATLASETQVFAESRLAIVPSQWAADALQRHVASTALKVLPFGANWGNSNTLDYVTTCLEAKINGRCRVLFVGRERYRKGLDLVLQAARLAEARGIAVDFDIVGLTGKAWCGTYVQIAYHGVLNPGREVDAEHMTKLWEQACFLMIPTRAEAFGMSFCEANAFGMPFITLSTGGSREILREGRNGIPATEASIASIAVEAFQRYYADKAWYRSFSRSSYEEFAQRLNWRVFGEGMRAGLAEAGLLP